MSLESRLVEELIRRHPERAAVALELTGHEEAARLMARASSRDAAPVLQRMTPQLAARTLEALATEKISEMIEILQLEVAARLVRRIPPERANEVLEGVSARRARALRALLRFEEGSAGAMMDPDVLALPETVTAREAVDRVRKTPEVARYNLYVVAADQRLVGVMNLRELLLARPSARLADFMVRDPQRLDARANRSAVVAHRGWREVPCLPVVDEQGVYLGAVRYRTLRSLEDELYGRKVADVDSRESLGELFTTGVGALLDAISAPAPTTREG